MNTTGFKNSSVIHRIHGCVFLSRFNPAIMMDGKVNLSDQRGHACFLTNDIFHN